SAGRSKPEAKKPEPKPVEPPPTGPVAVLTLDERGDILAAREACEEVLGYPCDTLVGKNVGLLLKGELDNEAGKFLERHRAGKTPAGTTTLRVTGRRRGGAEFPASITAVNWGWDTTILVKGAPSKLTWTAAFRDLS